MSKILCEGRESTQKIYWDNQEQGSSLETWTGIFSRRDDGYLTAGMRDVFGQVSSQPGLHP